ncbi:MAG: hypothetical protein HYV63_02985 [Candidatus Schekmanbacteria bacterium]|nr:hypothetical protein [Candidatus Schekmanbacteria bacterium]
MSATILIASSDAERLSALTALAQGGGYRVELAVSGRGAVEKARCVAAHAFLIDRAIRDPDVYSTTAELRSHFAVDAAPIYLAACAVANLDFDKAYACGCTDIFVDPIHPTQFRRRLDTQIRLQSQLADLRSRLGQTRAPAGAHAAIEETLLTVVLADIRGEVIPLSRRLRRVSRDLDAEHGGRMQRLVQRSTAAGERIRALIDDAVDVLRMDRGTLGAELHDANLVPLLEETVKELTNAFGGSRLNLSCRVPMAPIAMDAELIRRVLATLMMMSLRQSDPDGVVTVSLIHSLEGVWIAVRDNGAPMSPDYLENAARRESQVALRERGEAIGLGLGLYFCRRVAELHGGRLELSSVPGIGNTLSLILPVSGAPDRR